LAADVTDDSTPPGGASAPGGFYKSEGFGEPGREAGGFRAPGGCPGVPREPGSLADEAAKLARAAQQWLQQRPELAERFAETQTAVAGLFRALLQPSVVAQPPAGTTPAGTTPAGTTPAGTPPSPVSGRQRIPIDDEPSGAGA